MVEGFSFNEYLAMAGLLAFVSTVVYFLMFKSNGSLEDDDI